ncbi:MAG TPA: cation-transporting P-type ATPase, partial [Gaiellaceae bacterium]|nr:cation-transporting P-type ATPase [Gaiellaceae bacterium]
MAEQGLVAERASDAETAAAWHAASAEDVLETLDSDRDGLGAGEVSRRLAVHGPNVIPRAGTDGPLTLLFRQIHNPLIWVLIGAGLLAIALGKPIDGAVVLGVVVVNALIGFVQEFRAGKAIEALIAMVPDFATVVRGGMRVTTSAAELVPGDIVQLASGDKVPADIRLIEVRNLQADEAALTGESVPVAKSSAPVEARSAIGDRYGMVFGGTLVTYGTAMGVVVATGGAA